MDLEETSGSVHGDRCIFFVFVVHMCGIYLVFLFRAVDVSYP